jgi:uncharacterized protein (DUF2147 family)
MTSPSSLARSMLTAVLLVAAAPASYADPAASPTGLWKNVDDETGKPKALIRVSESDGVISGRIEKILTDKPEAVCDKCTDERKDKPVQGMTIISGMRRNAEQPGVFDGGEILDPNNSKVYRSRMKLIDGGRKLDVRGYVGVPLFGRTQTWLREE